MDKFSDVGMQHRVTFFCRNCRHL